MLQVILGIIQILILIFKNKFEMDAEKRKKNEELHKEANAALISKDISAINSVIGRMRSK